MALMLSLTLPVQAKAETEVPEIDSSYGNDLALPAGATRKTCGERKQNFLLL